MSMSRKDYNQIARIVGESFGEMFAKWPGQADTLIDLREILVGRLAFRFRMENDRFDPDLFDAAVGVSVDRGVHAFRDGKGPEK